MKKCWYGLILFFLLQQSVLAWNALGHCLIAQIAYNHLTSHAKQTFDAYNHALDTVYKPQSFVTAATWLDRLRSQDVNWFNTMHYFDLPFPSGENQLLKPQKINAIWAIREAQHVLKSPKSNQFDKGVSLRILLHVVGDIHQPLHAATRISKHYPKGDYGGNLFTLGKNPIAENLHLYWDKGGGFLLRKRHSNQAQVIKLASSIEQHWPCAITKINKNPMDWAKESYVLAVHTAYTLQVNQVPDKSYQMMTQNETKKRIALAGCRLAALLNDIDNQALVIASTQKPRGKHPKKRSVLFTN